MLLPVFQKADGVDAADASNITIQMHDLQTGVAIKGGSLVVYQVAKKDSAGKFQYTSQFSSVTANQGKLYGVSAQISDSGEASANVEGDAVYQVQKMEVLQPTAISKMVRSKYDLSLFTCTYDGTTRFTVRCHLLQIK